VLSVGSQAPDFEATDCQGKPVRLRDYRGRRVVLFFFPKAFTSGCTLEVRHFRDHQARIQSLGAELIGVSVDNVERQCAFAKQEQVDFPLLGDSSRALSGAFGVLWPLVRVDRRVTFVIGPEGVVEDVIQHEVRVSAHLEDVLTTLEAKQHRAEGA
jgi:thioredoxin-dependent peroxiredoxin